MNHQNIGYLASKFIVSTMQGYLEDRHIANGRYHG
jgi:hypothetical protein